MLLLTASRQDCVTIDEVGHVAAGISHWQTSTYSMYRVNPPLARMLAVLPVLAARPKMEGIQPTELPGVRTEWASGRFFAESNAGDYPAYVFRARLAGVVWSVLGGLLIFFWARELYGSAAGCLGVALWSVGPNVLAHAHLITPDIPCTVAGLAATYAFWHYLRNPSWRLAFLCGLLLGVAQLTKCTLLLLYGIWPLLWLIYRLPAPGDPGPPYDGTRRQLAQGFLMVLLSLLVINLGYEFRGSFRPLGEFPFISESFSGQRLTGTDSGNRFRGTWLGSLPVPVPADYLRGIDVQRQDFERLGPRVGSYLAGEWRETGWWYYYLYGLAVKVPLGAWVLVLWALVLTLVGHPSSARWKDEVVLWLPAAAFLGFISSQTGFTHHLRYVLPLVPFVLISTSKLGFFLRPQRWRTALVVLTLLGWSAASSLRIHPHYLSYFNELAGGPERGHDHLLNSNIDWGQDLLFLERWLDEHPEARPLGLACFNIIDPRIVGIDFTLPPFGPPANLSADQAAGQRLGPQPGYYAISVNYLRGGHTISPPDGKGGRVSLPAYAYSYFREFRPIARAGYSIYIYHITPEDANRVRHRYGLAPLPESRRQAAAAARTAPSP